jgi:hypothetical protein
MNEKQVTRAVNELVMLHSLYGSKFTFPKMFYQLLENEQKEVIRRYRIEVSKQNHPPWSETK